MTRIKCGYIARKCRNKFCLFALSFRKNHSLFTRIMTQQITRALVLARRDRGKIKRVFRRLWITRINTVIHETGLFYSYNH